MQARLGRLLAVFAALDTLYAIYRYLGGEPWYYLAINVAFVAVSAGLFALSCYGGLRGKALQVALVSIIGIVAVCTGENKIYGVMVLFLAFSICVGYGVYVKDRTMRLIVTGSVGYTILYLSERQATIEAALRAAIWLAFLIFLALTLWTIFRDQIKKSREDDLRIGKEIVESIMKTNEELIKLAKELYAKLNDQRG